MLTEAALEAALKKARRQLADEQLHVPSSEPRAGSSSDQPQFIEPDFPTDYTTSSPSHQPQAVLRPWFPSLDVEIIRRSLPFLQDLDDDYIKAHSYDQLVSANATLQRMDQKAASAGLSARLTSHYNELRQKPIRVEAGWDDCISQLHDARFLPGTACLLAKYWERGQQLVPDTGLKPLCGYDMVSLGLNACISTKGWVELHDPGSLAISIKYFMPSNVNLSDRAAARQKLSDILTIEEQLSEPASVHELSHALLAACFAQREVTPWNYSICAILGFFSGSRYCENYLAGRSNQAALLREFVDLILHANANNWRIKQPFLTANDIQTQWTSFAIQKNIFPIAQPINRGPVASPAKKSEPQGTKTTTGTRPPLAYRNICMRFNQGNCPAQDRPSCEVGKGPKKFVLQHLCLEPKTGGGACLGPHSQQDHGKAVGGGS